MQTTTNLIAEIENKWLIVLYNFCKEQFNNRLISHDHTHHLRVWKTACTVIKQIPSQYSLDKTEIEQLIFAVFFHDMGMKDTINPRHGKYSRNHCAEYLHAHTDLDSDHKNAILDAVEYHDDKSYSQANGTNTLLSILNIADDSDAFGAIGVYRYCEIWMLRGHAVKDMPDTIIPNLQRRFKNLKSSPFLTDLFIKKQEKRFHFTRHFFLLLKEQISLPGAGYKKRGPLGVIGFFNDNIIEKNIEFNDIPRDVRAPLDDYSKQYFEQLDQEISKKK